MRKEEERRTALEKFNIQGLGVWTHRQPEKNQSEASHGVTDVTRKGVFQEESSSEWMITLLCSLRHQKLCPQQDRVLIVQGSLGATVVPPWNADILGTHLPCTGSEKGFWGQTDMVSLIPALL